MPPEQIVVEIFVPFFTGTRFYHLFRPFFESQSDPPNRILPIVEGGKNFLEICFVFFQCHPFSKWPGMRHFARLSSIGIHLLHVWMGDLFHCQRLAGPTKTHLFFWKIYGNMSTLEMISSCILSIRLFAEFHAISEIIWTQEFSTAEVWIFYQKSVASFVSIPFSIFTLAIIWWAGSRWKNHSDLQCL